MKLKLKQGSAVGALLAAMVISPLVSAATMNFNNNSGVYVGSNGTVGIATPNTPSLTYSSTPNGGGIGVGSGTSSVQSPEFITILFNQRIIINNVFLAQWTDTSGLFNTTNDRVQFSYPVNPIIPTSASLNNANAETNCVSGGFLQPAICLGRFSINQSVDGIRIAQNTSAGNGWYVQSIDYSATPVPATAWLFGTALLGLGLMKRKKA